MMRPPLKKIVIPLIGLHSGSILIAVLIHVWFADFVAAALNMSVQAAYGALITLLMLITVVRTVLIVMGKDPVTQYIEDKFDRQRKK